MGGRWLRSTSGLSGSVRALEINMKQELGVDQ